MQRLKPVFFVGNKRSGTSMLVRLLNMHPDIFVAHEADIMWLLYQWDVFGCFRWYLHDPPDGAQYTVKRCKKIIRSDASLRDRFERSLLKLMRKGSKWLPPYPNKTPKLLGDKKPNQQTEVEIEAYTKKIFGDEPIFIHCVRHPYDFVESVVRCGKLGCYGKRPEEILAWWVEQEKRAIGMPRITVEYERLCLHTQPTMDWLFEQMGVRTGAVKYHNRQPRCYPRLGKDYLTPEAKEYVEHYGL